MINKEVRLPITRQCKLLELSRSGVYYTPVPVSAKDLELMRQIDEIHLQYPFYGSLKIRNELWANGVNPTDCTKCDREFRQDHRPCGGERIMS